MRSIILVVLLISVISCKKTTSQEIKTSKVVSTTNISQDQSLLTLFIINTSFDFSGINKIKVNTLLDNLDSKKALVKLFTDEKDGTGTLGWVEIDFDNEIVHDITLDPDEPKGLIYDKKLYLELRDSLYQSKKCFNNSSKELPYKQKIDIKTVNYNILNCNIEGISDWLCGEDRLRYIPIFKNKNVNAVLVPMDCGDSPYRFYLLTINNNRIISNLYVEGVLSEPENIDDLETTSFEINKDYIIKVKTKNVNGDIGVNQIKNYRITEEGKIEETK